MMEIVVLHLEVYLYIGPVPDAWTQHNWLPRPHTPGAPVSMR